MRWSIPARTSSWSMLVSSIFSVPLLDDNGCCFKSVRIFWLTYLFNTIFFHHNPTDCSANVHMIFSRVHDIPEKLAIEDVLCTKVFHVLLFFSLRPTRFFQCNRWDSMATTFKDFSAPIQSLQQPAIEALLLQNPRFVDLSALSDPFISSPPFCGESKALSNPPLKLWFVRFVVGSLSLPFFHHDQPFKSTISPKP